jgi:hypothetical protein
METDKPIFEEDEPDDPQLLFLHHRRYLRQSFSNEGEHQEGRTNLDGLVYQSDIAMH